MEKEGSIYLTGNHTYLPESEIAEIGRYLPQGIQERGKRSVPSCRVLEMSMKEETSYMK